MFNLVKIDGKLALKGKNELGFFKIVIGKNERSIIQDLNETLEKIYKANNCKPNIFTFYSNYYVSNIVMRSMKYEDFTNSTPMKKYAIIDLKASLGNYNNLFECLNFLSISDLTERIFYTEELEKDSKTKDKKIFSDFFNYSSNKILGLATLTTKYLKSTYGNDFKQNVVIDIETHPNLDLKEDFLKKHPRYKDEKEEEILNLMSRNPLYNKLYSYSICTLN